MTHQCALTAEKANRALVCIPSSMGSMGGRGFCPSALVRPSRESCVQLWSPHSTGKAWSCWSRARGGHKNDPRAGAPLLWGKAERVGAVQPGEEKAVVRPSSGLSVPEGVYRKNGENIFIRACCDRTRSNGLKLREVRFRLDRRKKYFTVRVVKHWDRLPGEAVEDPSLETFKARLDGALSNVIQLKISLFSAERLI